MAQQVVDALAPHHAKGAIFVLVDVRSVTGIDAEAREVFGKAGRRAEHLPPAFNATFGAPLPLRALANLITKFTRMTTMVVQHTADEAAARVWLTEKRRAYLARRAM
ncbi:MAG TPA: hypothetical protein VM580_27370 [Labilithrix sp.]|nr:hypothetical protein [Labilithrix sp.]